MTWIDGLGWALVVAGGGFFTAGTIGLLRFPDTLTRLHALTKADNTGLGLVMLGLALQADTMRDAGLLLLTWALVLTTAGPVAALLAAARSRDEERG
jgi:multicomponent Na+:H+ antiporter subunit G